MREQPKTSEKLQDQISRVSHTLGGQIVPSESAREILNLSVSELKEKYPERYDMYLANLRSQTIPPEQMSQMKVWLAALNNLDAYVQRHRANQEQILFEKQFSVYEDIRTALEKGLKAGYVKMPTGVGKTVLFSQVVESLGLKTLIVVPSKILVSQTGEKLEEFTDLEFGRYFQEHKDQSKSVTITTYASLMRGVRDGKFNPSEYGLLVLDEAHRALGQNYRSIIERFDCIRLGFTATPEFSERKHLRDLLPNEIHSLSIKEAAQEGLVSNIRSIVAHTDTDLSGVSITSTGQYNEKELESALNTRGRNLAAVQLYKKMFAGKRTIAYCSGIAHANDLSELFKTAGISAATISGNTTTKEREEILAKFRSGEISVLCNARILIEGFDEPKAEVAFNLHPTLSPVEAEQRGGRVVRVDPHNPHKWAYVVDFVDTNATRPCILFSEIAGDAEIVSGRIHSARHGGEMSVPPALLAGITVEGLRITVDPQEVMELTALQRPERERTAEYPPEGWLTAGLLSNLLRSTPETIKYVAEEYRSKNPEWFRKYTASQGFEDIEHYSPELIADIRRRFIEAAPREGWMTANKLRKRIQPNRQLGIIKKAAEKHRSSHPEWFKDMRGTSMTSGWKVEHYAPQLIELLEQQLGTPLPPEGWRTATSLSSEWKINARTISGFIQMYTTDERPLREVHAEWFHDYKAPTRVTEHFHPDLVALLKTKLVVGEAPPGWRNPYQLAREELKGSATATTTIEKYAERYRTEHPEWFKKYRSAMKKPEFYHPELAAILIEQLNIPRPPDGWESAYTLNDQVRATISTIQSFAERYRVSNPEWVRKYKVGGQTPDHYHPELVALIRQKFKPKE